MPVNSTHPLYDEKIPDWALLRDCLEGERTIKAARTRYVPILDKQSESAYQAYLSRGMFYGACQRTTQGLAGFVLRKQPKVTWPGKDEILKTIGSRGENFEQILQQVLAEVVGIGRVGILVDAGTQESSDNRPRVSIYNAEHIINWDEEEVNGEMKPLLVVLREKGYVFSTDGFEREEVTKFRVLRLGFPDSPVLLKEDGKTEKLDLELYYERLGTSIQEVQQASNAGTGRGVYFVDMWRLQKGEGGEKDEFIYEGTVIPRAVGGRIMTEIPFVALNSDNCELMPSKPPLADMAYINVSHFRNSVDLEHALHFTALPQPWASGFSPPSGELTIGSSVAWVTDMPGASAGYLEFTGQGLMPLEKRMNSKERLMAVLGARLLEEQSLGNETSETVKIRQSGDRSVLVSIAQNVSFGLSKVLVVLGEWLGVANAKDASVSLNSDFDPSRLDSAMMQVLFAGLQEGSISYKLFFFNLQRGEMIPDGWTEEEERAALKEGLPVEPRVVTAQNTQSLPSTTQN